MIPDSTEQRDQGTMAAEQASTTESAPEPTEAQPTQPTPECDERPFRDGSADAKSKYGRFNLAIIGGTGVGKSSLVNAVFDRDVAKVGKGLPVTRGADYYHDDSLGIWDLEGFEMGAKTPIELLRENLQLIAERPKREQISVVWYCVNSHADKLQPAEIEVLRALDAAGLPVILVLTKVDWTKHPITGKRGIPADLQGFCDWLDAPVDNRGEPITIPFDQFLLTSTRDRNGKGSGQGLDRLVDETLALAPEGAKDAFRIAQQRNLTLKRELARPVIVTAAGTAAVAAATPIPVAGAVILAPIQLGMMGQLAAIYDLELKTMMSAGALAQLGVQFAGQALARSALNLIPVAGNVVNGTVAAALTAATGEAWMRLCEAVFTGKIDVAKATETWRSYAPTVIDVMRKMAEQRAAKS